MANCRPNPEPQGFAEVLRRQREAAGLTQQELAQLADLSLRGISDLERGARRAPHPNTIRALASALALGEGARTELSAAARRGGARVGWRPTAAVSGPAYDVFVGRVRELGSVRRLLARSRLVTLCGPGGVGKTRLALEVAQGLAERPGKDVVVIDLALVTEPVLVPRSVAAALGLAERSGRATLDVLLDALRWRNDLLLVLDNCEHLLAACAELVDGLIAGNRSLRILTTSRQALGSQYEAVWQVPPMSQPKRDDVTHSDAVALFVARVGAVVPGFVLTDDNTRAVADACQQLGGLPLAIELAASRVPWLGVDGLAQRLARQLQLLDGRRAPRSRHTTLLAAVDWSYELLTDRERTVFEQLGAFSGGWTLAASESVCAASDVAEVLQALVQKSLITLEAAPDALEVRYGMLEILRQYAAERLAASGELQATSWRHACYFAQVAEHGDSGLRGPHQVRWLRRLDRELPNLRAALRWSAEHGEVDYAFRLAAALGSYWDRRGHVTEGRARLSEVLQLVNATNPGPPAALRMTTLATAARLAWLQGDYVAASASCQQALRLSGGPEEAPATARVLAMMAIIADDRGDPREARALNEQALALQRRSNDRLGAAYSLNNLGNVLCDLGAFETARECYVESAHIARDVGDQRLVASALGNEGLLRVRLDEHAGTRAMLEECLALARMLGDPYLIANSLSNLGRFTHAEGDLTTAQALHSEALTIRRRGGDRHGEVSALRNLGSVAVDRGDHVEAAALLRESLASSRALGSPSLTLDVLDALGGVAACRSAARRACVLIAAGDWHRRLVGMPRSPAHQTRLERWLAPARAALSPAELADALTTGQALSLDQAVDLALELTGE